MKRLLLGAVALIAASTLALAGGMFQGYPIVGGAAYCVGSSTAGVPGTTPTCNTTAPAGPSVVTGNELIPADTQLPSGQAPQTVLLSMASINALPYVLLDGVSQTYTVPNTVGKVILTHSTTITSAAITAPAAPVDGQTVEIGADHTVTTFSFVANTGQTLAATTPTVLTASTTGTQGYKFIYVASTKKWYRLQ